MKKLILSSLFFAAGLQASEVTTPVRKGSLGVPEGVEDFMALDRRSVSFSSSVETPLQNSLNKRCSMSPSNISPLSVASPSEVIVPSTGQLLSRIAASLKCLQAHRRLINRGLNEFRLALREIKKEQSEDKKVKILHALYATNSTNEYDALGWKETMDSIRSRK